MRTFLIVQGVSIDDIDRLSVEDTHNLWASFSDGLWGPGLHYRKTYTSMLPHMGSKEHPAPKFHELFPVFWEWITLGKTEEKEKEEQDNLARSAAKALMSFGGGNMPKHIQAIIEDSPKPSK